jgi:mRNA-degrading endonuclease RelE of RelBE toxin-antitoxin system
MDVQLGRAAAKALDKLERPDQLRIRQRLTELEAIPPQPPDYKHLSGHPKWYRIRSGDFRICYKIIDGVVSVGVIANRRDVYARLDRAV